MGAIKLKHTSGNGTILNSPAANPTNDITLKLPSTTGSAGQVLKVASANHSSTNAELEFAAEGTSGKILQVVSTTYTGQTTFNSESGAIVSGMTRTIQPTAASSKILISVDINFTVSQANYTSWINLRRGGSVITGAQGTNMNTNQVASFKSQRCSGGDVPEVMAGTYLDTPSYTLGDTLTYQVYFHQESGSTAYINFMGSNSAVSYFTRFVSTQTLFEVAA